MHDRPTQVDNSATFAESWVYFVTDLAHREVSVAQQ